MLKKVDSSNELTLFEYFQKISNEVPYYFPVDFDLWHNSMFSECSEEGVVLFTELETYLFYENNIVKGFIQYGISNYAFDENGKKDYKQHYAIIRNLYYDFDAKNTDDLLKLACGYFSSKNQNKIYAFFHCFGMSCYARHGKLHNSGFYMESMLKKYFFIKEHENVYFSKDLSNINFDEDTGIMYKKEFISTNKLYIKFFINSEQIGLCNLSLLPQGDICYLGYIEIFEKYRRQGLGIRCMNNIFYLLKEMGMKKVDLDTFDSNFAAQGLYEKTGFVNRGITRSYYTI